MCIRDRGKRVAGGVAGTLAGVKAATNTPTMQPCYGQQMGQPMMPMGVPQQSQAFGAMPTFVNPTFDEDWRPPPPPTTAPDHLHPEREEIANERAAAKEAE